jgi:RNA polymerase sigma factor for flagellar operon FliA
MHDRDNVFLSADELVLRFSGLVRAVAWRMGTRLPRSVDIEDLIQDGMLMLIQLRVSGEMSPPETAVFITQRVRGAMVDAMRALDPISRNTRRLARAIRVSEHRLLNELLRSPTHGEIADAAGIDLEQYFEVLRIISAGEHQSTDHEVESDGADPVGQVLGRELAQCTSTAISALPNKEHDILNARYSFGERMRVTAAKVGVTESRICQIQKRAIDRVREALVARGMIETA